KAKNEPRGRLSHRLPLFRRVNPMKPNTDSLSAIGRLDLNGIPIYYSHNAAWPCGGRSREK
ncbi:hypothetical protein LJC36_01895, partial [Desulfovibrio sp. OttesenSCG-928-C14]|nr:hypothetical protein [Desulfovibrio sp. OttesenSCG-928-C14]